MAERKLFGTDGIRGLANAYPLDVETAVRTGKAAAKIFRREETRPVFVIARDTRASGLVLEAAISAGLCAMGADVRLIGVMPTPAAAVAAKMIDADAGIVITASHNPPEDNGIKFFSNKGVKLPDEKELEIERLILEDSLDTSHITGAAVGKIVCEDFKPQFSDFITLTADRDSLKELKVVLDCANGAASPVAGDIFKDLASEVIVVNDAPSGNNINQECGAMYPENASKFVAESDADIGITFDGDADRLITLDEKGCVVDGDITIFLLALYYQSKGWLKNDTVVVTQYTNLSVDEELKKRGISTVRVANGDRYVIEEMLKNGYTLGGEKSGHIILGNYNTTGDGILAAVHFARMVKESGKPLSELAGQIELFPQVIDKVEVKQKRPFEEIPGFTELKQSADSRLGESGRLYVRYSGTQNVCRIMVEGPDRQMLEEINEEAKKIIAAGA
ncbi:phosphoglucosamine mutase [Sedimentisphaera salicampi]|uniref:phosphoglucosamine mutase n=1 Tax=Sedimentisphaera salicampi TaxID=1941349 RepID=UPI000B9B9975|nr:phosphoglucosamine mutase [Sedimentisphaera salicampi]OXU16106.1 Phosphoglucosamine mutase [Sedimentisphaera salicampi]